jgi:hypothetical protein
VSAPTARQLAELEAAVRVLREADARKSPQGYIPHKPHPKQAEFLALDCREALYGGAAGGGKSDALLMAALQYVHLPGYAALILRRTFRDLDQPDAIMARAKEWLKGTPATWNALAKRWTFPSGATLTFGYCANADDIYQYQGAALQFIGWDELTQFPERPYRYMFSRLRRLDGSDIPPRVRAATNPGGIGHEWVRQRFLANPSSARPFIPARLEDNPSLDKADYLSSLAELDATTLRQLRDGVWVRDAEGLVYRYDDARNGIDVAPECSHTVLAQDFGVTDPTSFNILGWREHDPTVYVLGSWKAENLSPGENAERVRELERTVKFHAIVGDLGGLGKGFAEEMQKRYAIPIEAAEKHNKLGYIKLLNGALERGEIKVVRATCQPLIEEWQTLPWDEKRAKESEGFDNHCADGVLYGWRKCVAFVERPAPPPKTLAEAYRAEEDALEEASEEEAHRLERGEWWEMG